MRPIARLRFHPHDLLDIRSVAHPECQPFHTVLSCGPPGLGPEFEAGARDWLADGLAQSLLHLHQATRRPCQMVKQARGVNVQLTLRHVAFGLKLVFFPPFLLW